MSAIRAAFLDKARSSEAFDNFRRRLRGLAKWFWLEGVSRKIARTDISARFGKAAFHWLSTDQDRQVERLSDLKALAERAIYETWFMKDSAKVRATIQSIAEATRGDFTVDEVQRFIQQNMDDLLEHGYCPERRAEIIAGVRAQGLTAETFTQAV